MQTTSGPEGVICYNFDPMIVTQGLFREAMKEYTDLGPRFIDINDCAKLYKPNGQKTNVCSDCRYYVDIIPDNPGCYGSVGFHPGKRMELNVGDGCHELNTYLHELGHVVGLNHEHQHPKRRVIIIKSEMKVDASEYVKFKEGERSTTAYDINSIMHYDGSEFCIPWFTPRGGFCDADKAGNWHGWSGCMEPAKAHCSPVDRTVIGRAAHLTGHDKANVRHSTTFEHKKPTANNKHSCFGSSSWRSIKLHVHHQNSRIWFIYSSLSVSSTSSSASSTFSSFSSHLRLRLHGFSVANCSFLS